MVTILSRIKDFLSKMSSLRWKLFIYFLLISIMPLLFFANTITATMESYFTDRKEKELKYEANNISNLVAKNLVNINDSGNKQILDGIIQEKSITGGFRIIIVDSKAVVVSDSDGVDLGVKLYLNYEITQALQKEGMARLQEGNELINASATILDDKEVIGAVLIIAPIDEVTILISGVTQQLFLLTVLLCVIVFIFVLFASQLILDPLKKILNVVKKMSEGHLEERIVVSTHGHDEFTDLSEAFNEMATKLEQVETIRQEFVSNVSHELKTPLSSMKVLGESILLQEEVPNEMYKEFLQDIISEVDRMTNIINELLALVKLDQKEQALNIKQFSVNKMIEDILKRVYPLAEQKEIELVYEDVKHVNIFADEMKLSLAISNLVENGIKYTQNGGTVKVIVDSDHQNCFITVQDNGIGISDEEQKKVFVRFYRVDKTRDRETGGTGLGLAITHKTVLLHHGSIKLLSKEDNGSTFVVRLPINNA